MADCSHQVLVRDLDCPDHVEQWRWETMLVEIGDLVVARAVGVTLVIDRTTMALTAVPCMAVNRDTLGRVSEFLEGGSFGDPDWWKE